MELPQSELDALAPEVGDDEQMPTRRLSRRHAFFAGFFALAVVVFLYFGLPQIAGINKTWDRIQDGDPKWLIVCALFELISFGGYIWLFRGVFVRGSKRINWAVSYQITMAGLVAARLFAAAGAGGAILTAWALRRSGMPGRTVATRMIAQYVILYAVYMFTLLIAGVGLYLGAFNGSGVFALTIVPAIIGGLVIILALACTLIPEQIDDRIEQWGKDSGWFGRLVTKLAPVPDALAVGVREALIIIRERDGAVFGAVIWWYFDIFTLWAAFHAFGDPPPFAVLVMSYYVGMFANLLPLPGGIGGVEGGMIGVLIAFGVPSSLAIVAVLSYRAFSFWLPTIPGAIAYFQLRRTVQGWRAEGRDKPATLYKVKSPAT